MTLIDGDRIVTAQLYDDEHEEFIEKKMSIIDYVNAYTDEGVTEADVVEQTGYWIEHKNNGLTYIECSECSVWFLRMHLIRNSYCPNCGKRMLCHRGK